jgi:S-disulfanyl-L-cysteine oxidoreductase SoxD
LLGCAVAALLAASAVAAALALRAPAAPRLHFADAENAAAVLEGKRLYASHCASCHGRKLQGQLLWQVQDEFAGRRTTRPATPGSMPTKTSSP